MTTAEAGRRDPFQCLFAPRSAAVVGSVAEGKTAYNMIRQAQASGYGGKLYAVNPKAQTLGAVPGFPTVCAIGQPVDCVIIASPAATVPGVLEDCGQAGVGAAVIITAGFGEVGNHAAEEEIKQIAHRWGIRLIGPNCAGLLDTSSGFAPTMEPIPPAGVTALVSQSGALGGAILGWAEEQGLGFSKFVSYGNRADLTEAEFLRYLAHDPETRCVALYVESVANGRVFMDALAECAAQKPVVVIKSGRSITGQRATLSHTGSMAGSDVVYDAAIRACGGIRAKSIEEMFDLCKGFVSLPPVRGKRIAIITNSGGPGVLAADQAEEMGLTLPEPGAELKAGLSSFLPSYCALRNPIDLTVEGTEAGYRDTLVRVLNSGEYDAALALNVGPAYQESIPLARGIHAAVEQTGKPVVVNFMAGRSVAAGIAYLCEHNLPVYPTGERAVTVVAKLADYYRWLSSADCPGAIGATQNPTADGLDTAPPGLLDHQADRNPTASDGLDSARGLSSPLRAYRNPTATDGLDTAPPGLLDHQADRNPTAADGLDTASGLLDQRELPMLEPDAMAWLTENGLPAPELRVATSANEAAAMASELGYPVVMKVVSPEILHKSDCGGVVLNVDSDEAARRAFESIREAAAGRRFEGVVIYRMVRGAQEVLLGLSQDPQFGPVVVFGLGGIYTEVLHDVAVRVAPVDEAEALAMIRQVRSAPLLLGARGRAPADIQALAQTIARLSQLPMRYPEIKELDLNPVFVLPDRVIIGDVRVITQS